MDKTLNELIDERNLINEEIYKKTRLFGFCLIDDHRCYNSWMLYENTLIESFHEKLDEEAIRDGSELYSESISNRRVIVRMEGLVFIQEDDYTITILKESGEREPDEKLWNLYCKLYPRSITRDEGTD